MRFPVLPCGSHLMIMIIYKAGYLDVGHREAQGAQGAQGGTRTLV
jgi:hypothetical protein